MKLRSVLGLIFILACLASFRPVAAEEINIAFWNVENLFDSYRNARTEREDLFVPSVLRQKMRKDAEILRELNADIVGLMEVENRNVLKTLVDDFLGDLGYRYIALMDETDERGIDVAMISRRPFLCYSFAVPEFDRGILVARFTTSQTPFYVVVNHWKSRFEDGSDLRMNCSQRVIQIVNEIIPEFEQSHDIPIVIGGDLNDNDTDASVLNLEEHGLVNTLKSLPAADRWTLPYHNRDEQRVELDSFDHIFINPTLATGTAVRWTSSAVVRPTRMLTRREFYGETFLWPDDDHDDHIGYSDHFPVMATIQLPE